MPFCLARCHYCAFATWDDRPHLLEAYAAAVVAEVEAAVAAGLPPATSAFFGGGTPSLLDAAQLGAIVRALPLAPGAEVSVECNPDTVDVDLLRGYREAGVTRIDFAGDIPAGSRDASAGPAEMRGVDDIAPECTTIRTTPATVDTPATRVRGAR